MKTLITGCSWIQRMHKQNKIKNLDIDYASFGGQGLWKISDYLKSRDLNVYDSIVVQLPTPIRNDAVSKSTTDKFNQFINQIKDLGIQEASNKIMSDYKDKIFEINQLHDKVVFFLYNVGGYPFRHPYDFGVNIDNEMIRFFEDNQLEHLYLSFESKNDPTASISTPFFLHNFAVSLLIPPSTDILKL